MFAHDNRNNRRTNYVYLQGSLLATREAPMSGGDGTYTVKYQHTDALGSPIKVTDAAGLTVETSEYEPYGHLANRALTDGPGFTGHVQDAGTGLTYMQQRYYDQQVGVFLSVDPVTAYTSPGLGFHRFWYANGNPYRFTDPDGRKAQSYQSNLCGLSGCETGSFKANPPLRRKTVAQNGMKAKAKAAEVKKALADPFVQSEMQKSWEESKPNSREVPSTQPGSDKKEQGMWVYVHEESGRYAVDRASPGARDRLSMPPKPNYPGWKVIFWEHDHPNTRNEGYLAEPSSADRNFTKGAGVPAVIQTHEGVKIVW
jgi:RHS repeat-associated protein